MQAIVDVWWRTADVSLGGDENQLTAFKVQQGGVFGRDPGVAAGRALKLLFLVFWVVCLLAPAQARIWRIGCLRVLQTSQKVTTFRQGNSQSVKRDVSTIPW